MKDPAVLFYTQDFLTGTTFFTDAERGQYIRLLCEQRQNGHIPENHMLSVCFTHDSPVFKKFNKDENGCYYNRRMEKEIIKRRLYEESRQKNGKKGGRPQKAYAEPYAEPYAKATDNHMPNRSDIIIHSDYILDLYRSVIIFFDENCRPKTKTQKEEWCDTLEKLIRIDGHSPEHIQNIIKRTRMDDFWRTNFLSVLKLRKKNKEGIPYFIVFEKKMNHEVNSRNNGASIEQLAEVVSREFGTKN